MYKATEEPLDKLSWSMMLTGFTEFCQHTPISLKIGHN